MDCRGFPTKDIFRRVLIVGPMVVFLERPISSSALESLCMCIRSSMTSSMDSRLNELLKEANDLLKPERRDAKRLDDAETQSLHRFLDQLGYTMRPTEDRM